MKPWRRDGDALVLELTADEATMLTRLVAQVRQVFVAVRDGEADHADPVIERLFPAAYDDEELARRRTEQDAKGWAPAAPRERHITPALKIFAKFAQSADKGAARLVD